MEADNMISLYDYLGRAAGMELGGKVYKQAKLKNIPTQIRLVNNKTYTGEVTLYPREFLNQYFKNY